MIDRLIVTTLAAHHKIGPNSPLPLGISYTVSMTSPSHITEHQRQYQLAPGSWDERVVLITGATGGLGSVLSHAFAKAGATVVLMGRHRKRLEAIYDELVAAGAKEPAMIEQDFTETTPEILQNTADIVEQTFSRLDALVHTAATLGELTPLQVTDDSSWRKTFDVNLHAARDLTMACLPLLSKTGNASVLFTLDDKPGAYWGGYGVSKAALKTLMHVFADENDNVLDENNVPKVAINGIQPGPMRTRLRRRAFSGELEHETPLAIEQLGTFLYLLDRVDKTACGQCWQETNP